jgi:hypothetical protein
MVSRADRSDRDRQSWGRRDRRPPHLGAGRGRFPSAFALRATPGRARIDQLPDFIGRHHTTTTSLIVVNSPARVVCTLAAQAAHR